MIKKGWIVFKNLNDVKENQFKQGRPKFNPFTRQIMMISGGFPDFVCIMAYMHEMQLKYRVQFCECKINGYLSKEEKEKCSWILHNLKIPILIASKGINNKKIVYTEYGK